MLEFLPGFEDGSNTAAALRHAMDANGIRATTTGLRLRLNWGHGPARQLEQISVIAKGANRRLPVCAEEVFKTNFRLPTPGSCALEKSEAEL